MQQNNETSTTSKSTLVLVFIAITLFAAYLSIIKTNKSSEPISTNNSEPIQTSKMPDKTDQYDAEYFKKAESEGRQLTAAEKKAYIQLKSADTIVKTYLNKGEASCNLVDEGINYFVFIKNGKIRINVENPTIPGSDKNTYGMILTSEGVWAWESGNKKSLFNMTQQFKNSNEEMYILGSLLPQIDSEMTFKESCQITSVADTYFILPEGYIYNETDLKF